MLKQALKLVAGTVVFVACCAAGGYWHERTLLAAQEGEAAPARAGSAKGRPAVTLHPHPQKDLPELTLPTYPLPRPDNVIRATYRFAAEHPEVLSYMPCYCGCQEFGHGSNEDCFVKARARNGDVTTWEEHGIVCAMCLAVAEQSMTMTAAHASLKDIRAEVERKYGHITGTRTATPEPPAAHARP